MKLQQVIYLIVLITNLNLYTGAREPETGTLTAPDTSQLNEFQKYIMYTRRDIEEGFYDDALVQLKNAEKLNKDAAIVHYLKGIIYDANRDEDSAYKSFKKAFKAYLSEGNLTWAKRVTGWLRTIKYDLKEIDDMESKLKDLEKHQKLKKSNVKKSVSKHTNNTIHKRQKDNE